jgi:mycothiol maleylpyruvate isomerase-like protein
MSVPDYLAAAGVAAELLAQPAVAQAWDRPSALAEFTVAGLAGHLARQITRVPAVLAGAPPRQPRLTLLDHYARSSWVGGDLDEQTNVRIRRDGSAEAAAGPAALAGHVRQTLVHLRETLSAEPADRVVDLPWTTWALSLGDFLATRVLEIAVHCDDLAVSVGVPTPALPEPVLRPVLDLLTRLAVHRHGATAVLRALSRAERAPATIAAI